MSLLKVSDNYSAFIVGNFNSTAETITVDVAPVKTAGYLTVFDLNGNQFEKIKYTGVDGLNLTGCIRGLSFDDNSDTPVVGYAKDLKNGMAIKMTVTQHYINPVIDFVNQYDGKWMGAVADYAALTALVDSEDGEVRVTLDDNKIYVYDLDTTTWKLAGAGGGAGTVYITNKVGTDAEGGDNMTFQLNSGSFPDKKYLQVYKNGVLQTEGATEDYVATGSNQAVFNAAVLDTDKITLLVVSVDLMALGGVLTQDVIPDADEVYDIGSEDFKINEIHTKEIKSDNMIDPDNPPADPTDDAYKLVRLDEDGKLNLSLLNFFGDGSDGDVVISTNTSLLRDMYYESLVINDGVVLNSNGFRIFVKNYTRFLGTGKIASNGNNGGDGKRGGNTSHSGEPSYLPSEERNNEGISAENIYTVGTLPIPKTGSNGGRGGNSSNGSNGSAINALLSIGSISSAGGNGGKSQTGGAGQKNGGSGGGPGTITSPINIPRTPFQAMSLFDLNQTAIEQFTGSAGAGSGGGGAGWYDNVSYSYMGGGGGASGGSGGCILFFSRLIITDNNNIFIQAKGGNGGNGGTSGTGGITGAGGGGAGGTGGVIILMGSIIGDGLIDVSGGNGGIAGSGGTTPATDGLDGNSGKIYLF